MVCILNTNIASTFVLDVLVAGHDAGEALVYSGHRLLVVKAVCVLRFLLIQILVLVETRGQVHGRLDGRVIVLVGRC